MKRTLFIILMIALPFVGAQAGLTEHQINVLNAYFSTFYTSFGTDLDALIDSEFEDADFTGVGSITFDAAAATITIATDGAAQDLTLSITGATDSSLILASSGTAADALKISTSAGGMDITVAGAAAGEDLDLASNTSINIVGAEADAAAVKIQASNAAGGITFDAGTAGIDFSDDNLVNVGDIACDDIVSDANSDIVLSAVKMLVKTIDIDAAGTTDYVLDNTAENTTEQVVTITSAIPAYAEVVSVQVRCTETVTGSASMTIDVGTASGGDQILSAATPDTANDILTAAVTTSSLVAATNAARDVFINLTPGADWDTLDAGMWAVMITYIDYGAAYAQAP